jgi:hypothetical protein
VTTAQTAPGPRSETSTASDAWVLLVPLSLVILVVSRYPAWIAQRSSLDQYFTGVYRSRVLARELILGIANGINGLLGESKAASSAGFIVGWAAVTSGGFVLAWWLLHRYARRRIDCTIRIDIVIAAVLALSATVLTPYDFLSYALIIAAVVVADSGGWVPTAVLAAAAVATRESGLLVIAVLLASCVGVDSWRSTCRIAACHRPLWAATIAGLTTYVALKTAFPDRGGLALFQHVPLRTNLTLGTAEAIVLAAGLVVACRWAAGPSGPLLRTRRRVLWLLAMPYLAIVAIGGIWIEAPRLVMPLVIGEVLLAVGAQRLEVSQ